MTLEERKERKKLRQLRRKNRNFELNIKCLREDKGEIHYVERLEDEIDANECPEERLLIADDEIHDDFVLS